MAEVRTAIQVFLQGWNDYLDTLSTALTRLTPEQLRLRAASHERSVGEIAQHIVAARVYWFYHFMGEGDPNIAYLAEWDEPDAPNVTTEELLLGLSVSWELVSSRLTAWTIKDLQHTFPREWRGETHYLSRSWVIWHVLEHDLLHAGEVSLTLGIHNLEAPRA